MIRGEEWFAIVVEVNSALALKSLRCIYILFYSGRRRQKFTTTTRTMRKMLPSSLVWVNVTFNRLFTAVTMNGWVLLEGFCFCFLGVVKFWMMVKKFRSSARAKVQANVVKKSWEGKLKTYFRGDAIDLAHKSLRESQVNLNLTYLIYRRFPNLLGSILHLQHHGRDVHKAELRLSTRSNRFYSNNLAGVKKNNILNLFDVFISVCNAFIRRYMNSFVNPVIYTIFNPEFRKAFKKIMNIG